MLSFSNHPQLSSLLTLTSKQAERVAILAAFKSSMSLCSSAMNCQVSAMLFSLSFSAACFDISNLVFYYFRSLFHIVLAEGRSCGNVMNSSQGISFNFFQPQLAGRSRWRRAAGEEPLEKSRWKRAAGEEPLEKSRWKRAAGA